MMDFLDDIEKRVQTLLKQHEELKKKNAELTSENELLSLMVSENEKNEKNMVLARERLEKLLAQLPSGD